MPARAPVRRTIKDRGAVAVEAAIITPLLILILFGILEFGLIFKDSVALTSAARAGARMASAEPRISTFAQDAADQVAREGAALDMSQTVKMWVYKADAAGYPVGGNGSFSGCSACVKFQWDASTKKFVPTSTTWLATDQNACPGDPGHDTVGIFLQINHQTVTGVISSLKMGERTVMGLEPMPTTGVCK